MFLWLSMNFLSVLIRRSQKTRNFNASTGNRFIIGGKNVSMFEH